MGLPISRLCLADKLAFALTPAWLYLPMTEWTGELREYMMRSRQRQAGDNSFTSQEEMLVRSEVPEEWLRGLQSGSGAKFASGAVRLRICDIFRSGGQHGVPKFRHCG